jgi:hypothetical protein
VQCAVLVPVVSSYKGLCRKCALQTSVLGLKVTELNTSLSIRPAAREVVGYILLGFGVILERTWCF